MGIIRWVFGNMLWVFLAAVVVVGAIYWDAVRPELVKLGIIVDYSAPAGSTTASAPAATPTAPAPAPASAPASAPVAAPTQAAAEPQAPSNVAPMANRMPMRQPQPAQPANLQAAPPALSTDLQKDWAAARTAYWQRDLEKAVTLYKALAEKHPDQADVLGELGNVYLQAGKRDEAAATYLAAGEALLKAGNPMAANKALRPLSMLAPDKADTLRRKIFEAANARAN